MEGDAADPRCGPCQGAKAPTHRGSTCKLLEPPDRLPCVVEIPPPEVSGKGPDSHLSKRFLGLVALGVQALLKCGSWGPNRWLGLRH